MDNNFNNLLRIDMSYYIFY